jgi:hypothetical protein
MLDSQHLTTLQASTACYSDSFPFFILVYCSTCLSFVLTICCLVLAPSNVTPLLLSSHPYWLVAISQLTHNKLLLVFPGTIIHA